MPLPFPIIGKFEKPKPLLLGGISLAVLLVSIGGYALLQRPEDRASLDQYTIPVKSESLTLRIVADGTVTPIQSVNLSPKVAGIVEQLLVEQGDRVKQGQILARMDKRDLEGQLTQAQGALAQAHARLDELLAGSRREEIDQAKATLDRWEARLAELQSSSRQEEIDQVRSQVEAAEAQVNLTTKRAQAMRNLVREGAEAQDRLDEAIANDESAKATLREARKRLDLSRKGARSEVIDQAEAQVEEARQAYQLALRGPRPEQIAQAEAAVKEAEGRLQTVLNQLADTNIRAPFGGIITQKFASEGAFVTPTTSSSTTASATSASIVSLAQEFEVLAEVPEIDISKVRPGQQVEIRADAYPEQLFQGRVRLVSPEAVEEQNVTSFQVRVTIITGRRQLRSGMNVSLTFLGDTVDQALVVPTVAIATEKGKTGVYIPGEKDKPEFKPITIGSSIQDKTQVLDGLKPGQRVFINFPEGQKPDEESSS